MMLFRRIRRLISLAAIGAVGSIVILFNPAYITLAMFSMLVILMIARNMNFYKIAMMLKRYAREASKLRSEIHLRLHTGFKDYSTTLDDQTRAGKTTGYVR
ncbi:MAG: hypothetical protein NWF05_00555 [Candidatus Bathyarchaeota archaeon]|nr:hypothetical protein [Candidatus Bathyarchaeota archaeon]